MFSYDPDHLSELDTTALAKVREAGLHPINVICDEPGVKVGDQTGVSFFAFVSYIPRVG